MRVKRPIYAAALGLDALLCATTILLWSTSAWRHYHVAAAVGETSGELLLTDYELTTTVERGPGRRNGSFAQVIDPRTLPGSVYKYPPRDFPNRWWIVRWHRGARGGNVFIPPTHVLSVRFPFWLIILPLLIWPALAVVTGSRRRRRTAALQCFHCGYDMRATPDRCPECGREAPHEATGEDGVEATGSGTSAA